MNNKASNRRLTNVEVLTYVVADLNGLEQPVHLEDIAARAFELWPGPFRWDLEKYSRLIDKDKVRVSLTDAKKDSNGELLRSVGVTKAGQSKKTDYWRLTPSGAAWMRNHSSEIASLLKTSPPGLKRGRQREIDKRLQHSALYAEFIRSGSVPYRPYELADLLECSPDASNEIVSDRFSALQGQVALLGDQKKEDFMVTCAETHEQMLEI